MGLRDIGAKLPPGFRFHPSDEELVCHYLYNKISIKDDEEAALKGTDLVEIDLHVCEPWQLPDVAKLNANEWYFFSFRDRKYATGYRTNRATTSGYWKATGKDRTVVDPRSREIVGMRKTLVFYKNRAPNGIKTCWIMHEFRLETPNMPPKEDWVLCRVFHKFKAAQDNTMSQLPNFDKQTIVSPPNHNYAPNYTNFTPPLSSPTPSSTIDHRMIKIPSGSSDPLIVSLSSSAPLDNFTQNDVNYHGDSLLSLIYQKGMANETGEIGLVECGDHEEGYGNFLWDMNLEKTSVGTDRFVSKLEDHTTFEIDNSIILQ